MNKFNEYLEAVKNKDTKIVFKNRRLCRIILNKRDTKFEEAIAKKTDIAGFSSSDSAIAKGYAYKFKNEIDWETALKLLGE